MNRRSFIATTPAAGLAFGTAGLLFGRCTSAGSNRIKFNELTVMNKVIFAMLSMQRATWEQGIAMQALLERGEKELVILMARDAVLRQSKDGRLAMLGEEFALTDAASPGGAVLWAAKETGDANLMDGHKRLLNYLLHKAPSTKDGIIYHFTNVPQLWSDSNYMLPPYLAVSGEYNEALKQIEGIRTYLWNKDKKLFSHIWDCEKKEFVRKDFWGVGNGWTAAGYTRVIQSLPDNMTRERDKLLTYLIDLLDG